MLFDHDFDDYNMTVLLTLAQFPSISTCYGFNKISLSDASLISEKSLYHYARSPLFLTNLTLVLETSSSLVASSSTVYLKNFTLTWSSSVPSSSFAGRVSLNPFPSTYSTFKLLQNSALKLFKSSHKTPGTTSISKSV